jgi:hypothetical protein
MSLWGNNDLAAQSAIFAPAQLKVAPNTANRTALYGNTTADAFVTDATVGQYGVGATELSGSTRVSGATVVDPGTGFTVRPTVTFSEEEASVNAVGTAVAVVVTAAPGTNNGSGYVQADAVELTDGTGTNAAFTVTTNEVKTVAVGDVAGTGYANDEVVTGVSGTGTLATFTVTTGASDTIPASLVITTGGSYSANPDFDEETTTSSGGGTNLTLDLTMGVETLTITDVGAYTALPTLTDAAITTDGSGTDLVLDVAIGVGPITLSNNGVGYVTVPTVTVAGTGGSGANVVAVFQATGSDQGVAHTGWNLRTEGTGGRAGRVKYETLVALHITGDATDDSALPE